MNLFFWLSNIPSYKRTTASLSIICPRTPRLLPCPGCVNSAAMNTGVGLRSFSVMVFSGYMPAIVTCHLKGFSSKIFNYVTCSVCVCLVAQLCPPLCNPLDCSLPGSSVHGIVPARILEWVSISSSRGSSRSRGSRA